MAVFLFLLPLLAASGLGQQKAGDLKIEDRAFTSAKGDKVDAEYGRLYVPENRGKVGSRLIELAFVRFKSTSPKPGPPIVYLAGGPGGLRDRSGTQRTIPIIYGYAGDRRCDSA